MKLAIAIPTYNRVDKLKKNIESIDAQVVSTGVEVSLVVANTYSNDETQAYLETLKINRDNFFCYNQKESSKYCNLGKLAATIPTGVDWVWLMGDDDYLINEGSIQKVYETITAIEPGENLSYVHACQARRSKNTGDVYVDNCLSLCNAFGYLDTFGWFSSQIVRRDIFCETLQQHQKYFDNQHFTLGLPIHTSSAFLHCSFFLQNLWNKKGAIIDLPLVETQDEMQTQSTIERWQEEKTADRYMCVVDDLFRLKTSGVPLTNLEAKFFRYHQYHLWDRLINRQLAVQFSVAKGKDIELAEIGVSEYETNWKRIKKLSLLLGDAILRRYLDSVVEQSIEISSLYIKSGFDNKIERLLIKQSEICNRHSYEFYVCNQ